MTWANRLLPLVASAALLGAGSCFADVVLPKPPAETIYNLKAPATLTTAQFNALASLSGLNLTTKSVSTKTSKALVVIKPIVLNIDRLKFVRASSVPTAFFIRSDATGELSFSRDLSKYEGDFAPTLPSDRSASSIAQTYLKNNKLWPTLAANEKIILAGVQTVRGARPKLMEVPINVDNPAVSFDKLKVVTYRREINGLPVVGPGSKIVVTIGDKNVVEGAIVRWRAFSAVAKKPKAVSNLIAPATALANFRARLKQQFPSAVPLIPDDGMGVALYDSNEKAMQPVYVFETNLLVSQRGPGADTTDRFLGLAPALAAAAMPEGIYQLGDAPDGTSPGANDVQ